MPDEGPPDSERTIHMMLCVSCGILVQFDPETNRLGFPSKEDLSGFLMTNAYKCVIGPLREAILRRQANELRY